MHIEVHTDKTIANDARLNELVAVALDGTIGRFGDQITRVEVHLSDENGPTKSGGLDISCRIEAKPAGHQAVAAGNKADSVADAVDGAAEKLVRVLDSTFGRLDHRKGGMSYGGDQKI